MVSKCAANVWTAWHSSTSRGGQLALQPTPSVINSTSRGLPAMTAELAGSFRMLAAVPSSHSPGQHKIHHGCACHEPAST
jgi:hypothetical protein